MKIQLEELDLMQPWPTLTLNDGYRQLRLLVRIGALPVAEIMIRPFRRTISSDHLRRRLARSAAWNILKALIGEGLRAGPESFATAISLRTNYQSNLQKDALPISGKVELMTGTDWREFVLTQILDPAGLHPPHRDWVRQAAKNDIAPLPPLTVLVCTRDRPAILEVCLKKLLDLDYPNYEILVADNSRNPLHTREVVDRFGVGYLRVPAQGKTKALNAAMRITRTRWMAFTDDDCAPERNWLRELVKPIRDSRCRCVTGLVEPALLENDAEIVFEVYGGLGRGFRPVIFESRFLRQSKMRPPATWNIGAGANMLIDRELVIEIGGYDEDLGPGRPGGPCEDIDMYYRLLRRSHSIHYTPRAVVHHYHRCDARSLQHQLYTYGLAHSAYHWKCFWRYRDFRSMFYVFYFLPKVFKWRWGESLGLRSRYPAFLLFTELRGTVAGPIALTGAKLVRLGRTIGAGLRRLMPSRIKPMTADRSIQTPNVVSQKPTHDSKPVRAA